VNIASYPVGNYAPPCRKCLGVNGAHFLTCPTLNISPMWYLRLLSEEGWI